MQSVFFKDYGETIDYLYNRLPMFQKIGGSAYKKDLTNTLRLCEALGNPERQFKTIHIAGTNGKGSTSHYLAAILQSAGYKTGLYTSPHLKNFTERIKINGVEMSEVQVMAFMNKHYELIEALVPSFFEITVAMAFDLFAAEKVDIAVIEVGMGGRLDSTNVISPEVSLITNISVDHEQWLGHTLPQIAGEKAGIIKPHTPVVISERQEQAVQDVFNIVAAHKHAPIYYAEDYYHAVFNKGILEITDNAGEVTPYDTPLKGSYQCMNVPAVLEVIDVLKTRGFSINNEVVTTGIENVTRLTGLKGRWQVLQEKPLVICDVGHNKAGIALLMNQIQQMPHEKLYIIWGTVSDKDVDAVLALLPQEAIYYFCQADIPRAMDALLLAEKATKKGLKGTVIPDVKEALQMALTKASDKDMIFVGGSTFVVAELDGI